MAWTTTAFRQTATPIFDSVVFSRLKHIAFLGILSPVYRGLPGFPIPFDPSVSHRGDRTRAHHSLMVAWLISTLAEKLQLSKVAFDYAVMWGLLHDVATWPLSHTGEAAFADSTETEARELRTMIIYGSHRLSDKFSAYPFLKAASLDANTLVALFDGSLPGRLQSSN
jgi:HD superfamily phosphohydrolase